MCNGALGLLRQVIADSARSLDQLNSFANRLDSSCPNSMYFFKVIIRNIPEHDTVKCILSIVPFLENDKQKLRGSQIVIEFRFFPNILLT